MENKNIDHPKASYCDIPRKQKAVEALLGLAWRKGKADRPDWLLKELKSY